MTKKKYGWSADMNESSEGATSVAFWGIPSMNALGVLLMLFEGMKLSINAFLAGLVPGIRVTLKQV